ncbi:elicitor-responsive protein 3 [Quillaja saponaria]|uniref:Elicitor-responsive protein 3 n=1 Tax=Quillaja saponaria TaxID=32244 RepID=A0AAD7PD39_QUISA|nr:elicitor-responsive protein 3 [Quillaja saponaria]
MSKLKKMDHFPRGTLEVLLVRAKGLDNSTDFLSNVDPYVILTYRTQQHRSTVATGAGCNPEWNQSFLFTVAGDVSELNLKIMDKDTSTEDDFLGESRIQVEPVFYEGSLPVTAYNVVKGEDYCGEIRVALTFTPEIGSAPSCCDEKQSNVGWREQVVKDES